MVCQKFSKKTHVSLAGLNCEKSKIKKSEVLKPKELKILLLYYFLISYYSETVLSIEISGVILILYQKVFFRNIFSKSSLKITSFSIRISAN